MADRKFSELSPAGSLAGTEIVAVTKGGETVRTTTAAIAALAPTPTNAAMLDTGGNHYVTHVSAEDVSANRDVEWVTGNATRRFTFQGDFVAPSGAGASLAGAETLDLKTLSTLRTSVQALSGPGAINVTTGHTKVTTTGADALTLADGADGQIKIITMIVDGGDGTLTPTNFGNGTTITFNDAGDSCLLVFVNSKWYVVSHYGCTVA